MKSRFIHTGAIALAIAALLVPAEAAAKDPGPLGACPTLLESPPDVLEISGACPALKATTPDKPYKFKRIHIFSGGELKFEDATIDLWASSIIVESGGKLTIGSPLAPIGTSNPKNVVTIHLYGPPTAKGAMGVLCRANPVETCGAPVDIWNANIDTANHNMPKRPPPRLPDTLAIDCKKAQTADEKANCVKKVAELGIKDVEKTYPGTTDDYFYGYHALFADDGMDSEHRMGYFGNKVLAVSYNGELRMFGRKGAIYSPVDDACKPDAADSTGRSWVRLAKTATAGSTDITVTKPTCGLGWADGDDIVITTTDYLPGHSEQRKIKGDPKDNGDNTVTITLDTKLAFHHNGERFHVPGMGDDEQARLKALGLRWDMTCNKAGDPACKEANKEPGLETRAAVGLLSRNIRIVSAGCALGEDLPAPGAKCKTPSTLAGEDAYFGGHTVFRQGFKTVQIQGVEFYQMGQGGRLGHYPVHFHHARKTANGSVAFVKDSSVWDSMTRWIVLHGTSDVTLARNVGYKSIGHGFYLEDGTEINNKLSANLGVFARAAVENVATTNYNPRNVPGILAASDTLDGDSEAYFPTKSDVDHPSVFWIMNGWNDFQYNMAAGAGTCGVCYWLVSGVNSTMSKLMKWESYASMQSKNPDRAGTTPLRLFVGNSCTSAMNSFLTVTKTQACDGVQLGGYPVSTIKPIRNPYAPTHDDPDKMYYPDVHDTGGRFATRCAPKDTDTDKDPAHTDCSTAALQPICSAHNKDCMITEIKGYTTSFHWAAFNFAAMWLRPQWYLLTDSAITDVQQAGLTMVTGGGYTASDVIPGHWAVVRKSIFVGNTQPDKDSGQKDVFGKAILMPDNPFASNGGPFNTVSKLRCAQDTNKNRPGNVCLSVDESISFPISAFGVYQRLFSVYDGPAFQDSNAYLNIKHRTIDDCKGQGPGDGGYCDPAAGGLPIDVYRQSSWWAGYGANGLLRAKSGECYMPNAAIGWKQPNGFYYPPAFHSTKLFFKNVDTRHFVVTPPFKEGTQDINTSAFATTYCAWASDMFKAFTSIDRQTVLNDDDGSLTGYTGPQRPSIVINEDDFFTAPVEAVQCASDKTSRTSPYEHVTTVVYPQCVVTGKCALPVPEDPNTHVQDRNPHTGDWDKDCATPDCYGVPLHRLGTTMSDKGVTKSIRMMGQSTGQRSTLTVNHGTYYMDTTMSNDTQFSKPTVSACVDASGATPKGNKPCNINSFKKGETYYLFLIYAKEDTEQTYRFYVGPGSTDDPAKELNMKLTQANIELNPIAFSAAAGEMDLPAGRVKWVNKANGIVEVTLKPSDFTDFAGKMAKIREANCEPKTYCTWDTTNKVCKDVSGSADNICRWAVYDPHCPEGGCIGIKWTMLASFQYGQGPDPKGIAVPSTCMVDSSSGKVSSPFNVKFTKVADSICPAEGATADDRKELNFTDVTPANCQDLPHTAGAPMNCQRPAGCPTP